VRAFVFAILVAIGPLALGAEAQPQCAKAPWSCFGSFELRIEGTNGPQVARMIRFSNDEFMAELEQGGVKKQYLQVSPSRLELFAGLTENESPRVGSNNPFMFLDIGFAYPAMALQMAYPTGPDLVPLILTTQDLVLEKRHPATLTTIRESASRIRFRLSLGPNANMVMEGLWDGALSEPLPDDLPMSNWRHDSAATITNLGEARSLVMEQMQKN
jgi:hypothetical protein